MDSEKKEECYNVKPVVNWKCIWFTLALAGGYWFLPKKNKWILLALLYFPYIVLAFYDHHYDCKRNMGPTYLAMFYHWAKPQDSKQIKDYKNWCPDIKSQSPDTGFNYFIYRHRSVSIFPSLESKIIFFDVSKIKKISTSVYATTKYSSYENKM